MPFPALKHWDPSFCPPGYETDMTEKNRSQFIWLDNEGKNTNIVFGLVRSPQGAFIHPWFEITKTIWKDKTNLLMDHENLLKEPPEGLTEHPEGRLDTTLERPVIFILLAGNLNKLTKSVFSVNLWLKWKTGLFFARDQTKFPIWPVWMRDDFQCVCGMNTVVTELSSFCPSVLWDLVTTHTHLQYIAMLRGCYKYWNTSATVFSCTQSVNQ